MTANPSIVWFRRDLRLDDNPALAVACRRDAPVIPVFIWEPEEDGRWAPGGASRWWLHQSLSVLEEELRQRGSRLIFRRGEGFSVLRDLLVETRADAVYWNRLYEPQAVRRDVEIKQALAKTGVPVETFPGALLFEPWTVRTKAGTPYRVFTPFYRACLPEANPPAAMAAPPRLAAPRAWPRSIPLAEFHLEPRIDWTEGMRRRWRPGEKGPAARLARFVDPALRRYPRDRDRPDFDGTSSLSPHLHFGEISPGQVWRTIDGAAGLRREPGWLEAAEAFQRQLIWREFAHHVLYHHPETPEKPLRAEFASFPWRRDQAQLRAWQRGRTGYPIVDAGMRQLWTTGWMHNRVRMIVASFLVKDLLIPWQDGARWFWDTLVDANLANNTFGWQWAAGCGADAAPYFRIFNPVTQGERFDPDGGYVRRWVPELARLPAAWIHKPWEAPQGILGEAGVRLGKEHPAPIVDHAIARKRALASLGSLRRMRPS